MGNNYEQILCYFDKKKDENNLQWIKFENKFNEEGKQGIVGLVKINDKLCIYKISRNLNFLIEHELTVMSSLKDIWDFCPFFCRPYGQINHLIDANYKKKENPFEIESKHPIMQETLFMEYLPYKNLYTLIKDLSIPSDVIISAIKQILLALYVSQKHKNFTHYDLHSCNLLMEPCDKDLVMVFVLNENDYVCIPTKGYIPKIIDFGFSHVKETNNNYIWSSLAHTEIGFISDRYDGVSDMKLFLITVSNEMKRFRSGKDVTTLRRLVKNIFKNLEVDWESGWDENDDIAAIDMVSEILSEIDIESHIFNKYNHFCMDILQSLIKIPLRKKSYKNLENAYKMLTKEFGKIEKNIGDSFTNIYLLKHIVNYVRQLKVYYFNKETEKEALKIFKNKTSELICDTVEFYIPKINFEKLFCSLIAVSNCIEGIMYSHLKNKTVTKNNEYSNMELNNSNHIYGAIEVNIDDNYVFNETTRILVLDGVNKTRTPLEISQVDIDVLNETHPLIRGNYFKKLLQKTEQINFE